jgi:hypothetical protein
MKQISIEGPISGVETPERIDHANETLGWFQRPEGNPPKQLVGQKAVNDVVFGGTPLIRIAARINKLEFEEDVLAAQLAVSGFGSETIHQVVPNAQLDQVMPLIGATAHVLRPRREPLDGRRPHREDAEQELDKPTFDQIFSLETQLSHEVLAWMRSPDGDQPMLGQVGQHRLDTLTDDGGIEEVISISKNLPVLSRSVTRLLIAGFNKPTILSQYDDAEIKYGVVKLREALNTRREWTARRAISTVTNKEQTIRKLSKLPINEEWGRYIACGPADDSLLELKSFKRGVDPRARQLCHSCMVRLYCLENFLFDDSPIVRGGLSNKERKDLRVSLSPESNDMPESTENVA